MRFETSGAIDDLEMPIIKYSISDSDKNFEESVTRSYFKPEPLFPSKPRKRQFTNDRIVEPNMEEIADNAKRSMKAYEAALSKIATLKLVLFIDCDRAPRALDELIQLQVDTNEIFVFAFVSSKDRKLYDDTMALEKEHYSWLALFPSFWIRLDVFDHAVDMECIHFHFWLRGIEEKMADSTRQSMPFLVASNAHHIFELAARLKVYGRTVFLFNPEASLAYYIARYEGDSIKLLNTSRFGEVLRKEIPSLGDNEDQYKHFIDANVRGHQHIIKALIKEKKLEISPLLGQLDDEGLLEPARAKIVRKLVLESPYHKLSLSNLGSLFLRTIQEKRWNGWLSIFMNRRNQDAVNCDLVKINEEYYLIDRGPQ